MSFSSSFTLESRTLSVRCSNFLEYSNCKQGGRVLVPMQFIPSKIFAHHNNSAVKWRITVCLRDKSLRIEPVDEAVNTLFEYNLSVTVNSNQIYGVCVYNGDLFKCGLPDTDISEVTISLVYQFEAIIFCPCSMKKLIAPLQQTMISNAPLTKPRLREEFFDVQFMVENKPIVAHKIILADKSEVFSKMFMWNVDDPKNNKPIPIVDVSYDAFNQFIDTIYYGTTPTDPDICMEMISLAEKYDIQDVKTAVETPVIESINIDNAINILIFSHKFKAEKIKKVAMEFCAKSYVHEMEDSKELAKYPDLMIEIFKQMSLTKKI